MAWTSFTLVMLAIAGEMALVIVIVGMYGVTPIWFRRGPARSVSKGVGAQPAGLLGMFVRHD
jgi:hypothetical protein